MNKKKIDSSTHMLLFIQSGSRHGTAHPLY